MQVYTGIMTIGLLLIGPLYAADTDTINAINDFESKINPISTALSSLKTSLEPIVQAQANRVSQLHTATQNYNQSKTERERLRADLSSYADILNQQATILPSVKDALTNAVAPLKDQATKVVTALEKVDADVNSLLDTMSKNTTLLQQGLTPVVNTTLPTIIQKITEIITTLDNVKSQAANAPVPTPTATTPAAPAK